VSSFTLTALVPDERHGTLRDAIISLCCDIRHVGSRHINIRVDPAPGFVALKDDPKLRQYGISLTIGHAKNVNKNPVAERAIEELGLELLHLSPQGGPISSLSLSLATSTLNSRIRHGGLSSLEIWTQRDQVTGEQLPINDRELIMSQHSNRLRNHSASIKSKARGKCAVPCSSLSVGDLVYLKCDKDKTKAREKYLVIAVEEPWCTVRKFTQTQFRSKSYTVTSSECYPVSPTILVHSKVGPIRGLDDVDSAEEDDICLLGPTQAVPEPAAVPPAPPPPAAIVTPPITDSGHDDNLQPELDIISSSSDDVPHISLPHTRQSSRPRKPPPWMALGEWNLDEG
jgi:hypothetical protein